MNNKRINNSSSSNGILKKAANMTKNLSSKGVEKFQSSSGYVKIIFFIILILFIAFLIYVIYVAVLTAKAASADSPVIVNDVIDAFVARPAFSLPPVVNGTNQSFSTWIYVKDWNYQFGSYKNVLWRGDSNVHSPSIWLYPLTNSLKVITSTTDNNNESCDISNIPLMSWVHIVYVLNNRTVDIYINGKLERSCALRGIPYIGKYPVYITGKAQTISSQAVTPTPSSKPAVTPNPSSSANSKAGFYGKIGKTQYFVKPLLPNDVATLYQQGPLGSSQYQVQFFADGQLVSVKPTNSFGSQS